MTQKQPQFSVILPAWNARAFLADSVASLQSALQQKGIDYEILVVDDGSADGTSDLFPMSDPRIRLIRLKKNCGKGAALRTGFRESRGRCVGFTDADLPYGSEPLVSAFETVLSGEADAVIGDRRLNASAYGVRMSPIRRLLSNLCATFVRRVLRLPFSDTQCGLKVFEGDLARRLGEICVVDRFAIDVEIIHLLGRWDVKIQTIPVQLRHNHPSTVRLVRDSAVAAWDILCLALR